MQTSVIVSAFHQGRAECLWQRLLKKWQVLLHQLLLQILGPRGNNHTGAAATRGGDRRHQVSEWFAGPGAGFDDEMTFLFEGPNHRLSHFNLARTMFILRMSFGDYPIRAKDCLHNASQLATHTCDG